MKWIIGILVVLVVALVVLKKTGKLGGDEGAQVAVEKVERRTIIETVNASGKIYPEVEVKVSPDISGEITMLAVKEGDSVRRGQILARIYADIYATQQKQAEAIVSQQEFQVANVEAQIAGLKSAVEQAKANYNRQKKLLDTKVISQAEFETAENQYNNAWASYNAALKNKSATQAAVRSAQASLQRASKDVGRATIVSPMDGVVSLMNVKEGERVVGTAQMAGTEMMRIADMKSIEVRVDVTENDIPKVKTGDSALISVDAYLDRKFKGIVYQIASSQNGAASQNSLANTSSDVTNYKVYIRLLPSSYQDLINKDGRGSFPFRWGMTASADIQTRRSENVLSVPINAVTTRDKNEKAAGAKDKKVDKPKGAGQDDAAPVSGDEEDKDVVVFVLQRDKMQVKKTVVKSGIQDTRYMEILDGLKEGEEVVSEPYNTIYRTLKNESKVKVVPKEKLFEAKK